MIANFLSWIASSFARRLSIAFPADPAVCWVRGPMRSICWDALAAWARRASNASVVDFNLAEAANVPGKAEAGRTFMLVAGAPWKMRENRLF